MYEKKSQSMSFFLFCFWSSSCLMLTTPTYRISQELSPVISTNKLNTYL